VFLGPPPLFFRPGKGTLRSAPLPLSWVLEDSACVPPFALLPTPSCLRKHCAPFSPIIAYLGAPSPPFFKSHQHPCFPSGRLAFYFSLTPIFFFFLFFKVDDVYSSSPAGYHGSVPVYTFPVVWIVLDFGQLSSRPGLLCFFQFTFELHWPSM